MTKTVDLCEIEIPGEFVDISCKWYHGQSDMLYAVCSSGGLELGTQCPGLCYDPDERVQNLRWWFILWKDLDCDVSAALRAARLAMTKVRAMEEEIDVLE